MPSLKNIFDGALGADAGGALMLVRGMLMRAKGLMRASILAMGIAISGKTAYLAGNLLVLNALFP